MDTLHTSCDLKTVLTGLPPLPGVYRMVNAAGDVIYVGKAGNLRKRVSSYFHKKLSSPRIQLMVSQIMRVDTTVTRSETEALLLEVNLIKTLSPRYNILFTDDKSYPYIRLSGDNFPQLSLHRGTQRKPHSYFGPFPNVNAARESIQLLQKIFHVRTCENSVFSNRSRPCLQYQIKRCTAPCTGYISQEDYAQDIANTVLFLQGQEKQVLENMAHQMRQLASLQAYEAAAIYRDRIHSLKQVQTRQFVSDARSSNVDVIACVAASGFACVNLVMIRGGRHLGDRSFIPKLVEDHDESSVTQAFIEQHYVQKSIPDLLITDVRLPKDSLQKWLSQCAGRRIHLNQGVGEERKAWITMAKTNAALALQQHILNKSNQHDRVMALREAFHWTNNIQRIECFDISHTMGEATVASCVVFDQESMCYAEYRRYNIQDITLGDDYAAMCVVMTRRYSKLVSDNGKLPDAVLVDGGKGQLQIAVDVMHDLGLGHIHIVGIAKGEGRKPGLEQFFLAGRSEAIHLPPNHLGLHLLQHIRDEAHRFAITGHRSRRAKSRSQSSLQAISGVGAKRSQKLLTHFGGLKGILSAGIDDIAKIEGISTVLAEKIYRELH